jgi:hypothetical protein
MGKYVNDLPSKNPARSVEKIETFLRKQGFFMSGRPGKEVWKRTSSAILSPEYISVTARDEHVHVEAWVKAVTPLPRVWVGKADPHSTAPIGVPSKERLRARLERIEQLVG